MPNRYKVGELLGRGGMGQVHSAHNRSGRLVAIKKVRNTLSDDKFLIARQSNNRQKPESWPRTRMAAYIRSQVTAISSSEVPVTMAANNCVTSAAVAGAATGALHSPQPTAPSSVDRRTSTASMVSEYAYRRRAGVG